MARRSVLSFGTAILFHSVGASSYNQTTKIPFSYWSSAAYCSEAQLKAWSCKACNLTPHPTDITVVQSLALDAYGFVARQPDASIVVAFRGSQDIRNWIANIDAFKTAVDFPGCSGCEVHSGWYDAWTEVSSAVLAAVDAYGGKSAPTIHVTGHSLGASLGNLAFIELLVAGYPVDALYNFGCPRVGNNAYAAYFTALLNDTSYTQVAASSIDQQADSRTRRSSTHSTTVPVARWSAVLIRAISSALTAADSSNMQMTPAEMRAVRALLVAAHNGTDVFPSKTAEVARGLLARLPAAVLNSRSTLASGNRLRENYRVIHHDDVVPHLPPYTMGFVHEAEEVWYSEDQKNFTECSISDGEDQSCSWSVPVLDYSISDHLSYDGVSLDC